jgi:hypothetical protein
MRESFRSRCAMLLVSISLLWGCAWDDSRTPGRGQRIRAAADASPLQSGQRGVTDQGRLLDTGWKERTISDEELRGISEKYPELNTTVSQQILARLNTKAYYYISDDIRKGRPLKVPNDFRAYRDWTPLPRNLGEVAGIPRLILIVKDIPFLGWYEKGTLVGDSQVCIGKKPELTRAGSYRVVEKDARHVSRSYPNSFGEPALMPWALRVYNGVWIHAGDVTRGYCSPGCIVLPLEPAEQLYDWADMGTAVLVVESLVALDGSIKQYSRTLSP